MATLNRNDETLLLDSVKRMVDIVDAGSTPNQALSKVARDQEMRPGFVKSCAAAYNTGRQLSKWHSGKTASDRMTTFPLADADVVIQELWGEKRASETQSRPIDSARFQSYRDMEKPAYDILDMMTKQAGCESSSGKKKAMVDAKTLLNSKQKAYQKMGSARDAMYAAESAMNIHVYALETYFKKMAIDRLPFAQVENGASSMFGEPAAKLMTYLHSCCESEKRAADLPASWSGFNQPVRRSLEPYRSIDLAIKSAAEYVRLKSAFKKAAEAYKLAEMSCDTYAVSLSDVEDDSDDEDSMEMDITDVKDDLEQINEINDELEELGDDTEKEAGVLEGILGGSAYGFTSGVGKSLVDSPEKLLERQVRNLESPDHMEELRKIRSRAMLAGFLSDPENPISQHDPDEVLEHYNNLVKLAPHVSEQPEVVSSLLQRRLVGQTQPFELLETVKLNKGLERSLTAKDDKPQPGANDNEI